MSRRNPSSLTSDGERPESARDADTRVIYPGVAGFDPVGHRGRTRSLLFAAPRPRGLHDRIRTRVRGLRGH